MAVRNALDCDQRGAHTGEVRPYKVEWEGETWMVDLCEAHGSPLERMAKLGRAGSRRPRLVGAEALRATLVND